MARTFISASSQTLSVASLPASAVPLTLAAWVKASSVALAFDAITLRDAGSQEVFRLRVNASAAVLAQTAAAGAFASGTATGAVSAGTWTHVAAVFASATSRIAYRDGGNAGSDATNKVPGTMATTEICGAATTGNTIQIALPAIWSAALSAGEVAALAAGLDPRLLQSKRAALVAFWPLALGLSPEPDWVSAARNLTVTGATRSDDPPNLINRAARRGMPGREINPT